MSAITIIILPINVAWRSALFRYGRGLAYRYDYLREIEQEFRTRRGIVANQPEIGLFLRLKDAGLPQKGHMPFETPLAMYFIFLYPLIVI
jgi:hypothetical protein